MNRSGIKKLSYQIDTALEWSKWPFGLVSLVATIPAVGAFIRLIRDLFEARPTLLWQIISGVAAYVILWHVVLRRTRISFFSTLEHEITHAIFALATLHPVTGLRASLRGGGQMTFRGKGNWIITLSPYFFPTATVATTVVLMLMPNVFSERAGVLFGASIGYHIVSTYSETHGKQSDIQKAGYVFTALVLPFTSLLLLGLCIAGYAFGFEGCVRFLTQVAIRTRTLFGN